MHQNVSWEAQQAPAWERVRSRCGQHCGLGCGAALEVGGEEVNGSGSTRMNVLDCGGGMLGPGQATVACKGDVPDKSALIGGVPG